MECLVEAVEVSICPPQIPHRLTRARTRAAALGSRGLTARVWHSLVRTSLRGHVIGLNGSSAIHLCSLERDYKRTKCNYIITGYNLILSFYHRMQEKFTRIFNLRKWTCSMHGYTQHVTV
jgi:hypothetical protein